MKWIVSSDGRLAVKAECITKIEASTNGKVRATTIANGTSNPDAYIGLYENDIQAGIALNELLDDLDNDQIAVWYMPTGAEPYMNIEAKPRGGGFEARGKKTTGKTK